MGLGKEQTMAQPAYQYSPPPLAPVPVARTSTWGLLARIVLTLVGAAGMILGAFLAWARDVRAIDLDVRALYRTTFAHNTANFVATVGFVVVVLGLLAVVGLAARSGWLTRLAGALGIVTFVLFVIELYRAAGSRPPGAGAWISLAGSVVALVGGFLGTRSAVVRAVSTAAPVAG